MSERPTRFCKITFMDGESWDFTFEAVKDEGDPTLGGLADSLNQMSNLVLELDGRLTVIPFANVRSVDLSPAPAKLPSHIPRAKRR